MRMNEEKRIAEREKLWQAIRKAGEFRLEDVLVKTALNKRTVEQYLQGLSKCEKPYLEAITTQGSPRTYKLVRDSQEPPRVRPDGTFVTQGQGRKNLWRTMRIMKQFDFTMLVEASSTDTHKVAPSEAKTYLRYLIRAGYVRQAGKDFVTATFRLVRDTGPKPPMIQRVKQVYDPNLKKVTWSSRKEAA
jgi:hypothetical protein